MPKKSKIKSKRVQPTLIPLEKVDKATVLKGLPYVAFLNVNFLSLKDAQIKRNLRVHGCFRGKGYYKPWYVLVSYTTIHGDPMINVRFRMYQSPEGRLFAKMSNILIPVASSVVYLE